MNYKTKEIIETQKNNEIEILSKYRMALMGAAALWILSFHTWKPFFLHNVYIFNIEIFFKVIGYYGVDMFFFLSGIGLTYSISKSSTLVFYYKRIKRIVLPAFITSLVYMVYNNWTILEWFRKISFYDFYTKSIYTTLWFIPAIISFYIIFPLYYKLFKKVSHKELFTIGIIAMICFALIVFRKLIRVDLFGLIDRIIIFLIGILLGWNAQNKKINYNSKRYIIYILMLIIGLVISYFIKIKKVYFIDEKFDFYLPNLLVAISLSFLLTKFFDLLSTNNNSIIKGSNKIVIKFLSFFGIMSLEMYCVQVIVIDIIYKNAFIKNFRIENVIIFIASGVLGFIMYSTNKWFWDFIEKLYNTIKKKGKINNENNSISNK